MKKLLLASMFLVIVTGLIFSAGLVQANGYADELPEDTYAVVDFGAVMGLGDTPDDVQFADIEEAAMELEYDHIIDMEEFELYIEHPNLSDEINDLEGNDITQALSPHTAGFDSAGEFVEMTNIVDVTDILVDQFHE